MMKRFVTLGLLAVLALGAAGIGFVAGRNTTEEVRVVARSTTDGRIEFGIEHDGERILPSGRYFPADAQVGRWLRSTPVDIAVGGEELDSTPASAPDDEQGYEPNEVESGFRGLAYCSTSRDRFTDTVNSYVSVRGNDLPGEHDGTIQLNCAAGFWISSSPISLLSHLRSRQSKCSS